MLSDIEIASAAKMLPIDQIAQDLGVLPEELEPYGRYKAKLAESIYKRLANRENGKLVLVTAINPTPAGEGKTTTTVGLADGLRRLVVVNEPCAKPQLGDGYTVCQRIGLLQNHLASSSVQIPLAMRNTAHALGQPQ